MVGVRQAVPHRHAGPPCQILHHALVIAPVLDAVKEPSQHLGGVLQRLLFAHLRGACVQIGNVGALLGSRHLKGAAGAGGGFFKQQDNVLALHGRCADARPALGLQIVSQIQKVSDLRRGKISQRQKAAALQIDCHDGVPPIQNSDCPLPRGERDHGSSRISGILMQRGPPRPRLSSALGMAWMRIPASSRERLVT